MSTNTNWNVQEWADQCLTDSKRISSTSKSESKSSKSHRKWQRRQQFHKLTWANNFSLECVSHYAQVKPLHPLPWENYKEINKLWLSRNTTNIAIRNQSPSNNAKSYNLNNFSPNRKKCAAVLMKLRCKMLQIFPSTACPKPQIL